MERWLSIGGGGQEAEREMQRRHHKASPCNAVEGAEQVRGDNFLRLFPSPYAIFSSLY
jgi:hypothetical protein